MFNLGVIYEEQGNRAEALKTYQEVLKLDPAYYKAKVNLAILLEKEGQSHLAFDHYNDAIKANPKEPKIY